MADLHLIRYRIEKFSFSLEETQKMLLGFNITPSINFNGEECELKMKIQINGKDGKKEPLKLSLNIVGSFQFEGLKENEKEGLCKTKGAYELLQVARSIILSFTSQAGMNPGLIIPPVDLEKTFEEEK